MLKVFNPYDGTLLEEIAVNSAEDLEQALNKAHTLFSDRQQWLPAYQRVEILERVVKIMESQVPELTEIATKEGGKP